MMEYTYGMRIYLGKGWQRAAQMMTATQVRVGNVTGRVDGVGHKLYLDNFFSSPYIYMTCTQHVITLIGLLGKIVEE